MSMLDGHPFNFPLFELYCAPIYAPIAHHFFMNVRKHLSSFRSLQAQKMSYSFIFNDLCQTVKNSVRCVTNHNAQFHLCIEHPLVVAHLKRMISERLELVKRNLLHPFALCIRSIFLGLKDIIDRSEHDVLRAAFQAPAPPSSTADRLLIGKTDNVRIHFLLFLSDRCKKAACIIKQLSDLFFIVSLQAFHQIVEHMPACISAAVCKASKPYPCGQPLCSFLCTKKLPISRKFLKMVEVTGFEPATFWSRTKRATKLRYTSKMEPMKGLEPLTCGLRNRCSTD